MDTTQWLLLELIGVTAVPLLVPILTIAFVWRSINYRALFSVLAFFSSMGIWEFVRPFAQDFFNPSKAGPATFPSAQFNVLLALDLSVIVFGIPLLLWLRKALRRT